MLRAMVLTELRLRLRRASTLVVVLALMALTWLMIPDPSSGNTLIAVEEARMRYTSGCLALGGALMAGLLFGLAGFYLVRGRTSEDMLSGAGGVLAASAASNAALVLGRWLGAVAYLCAMILAFLGTMLALHLLRGEGPVELGVYLQHFALILLPTVFFAAAMALLCEAFAPLAGKAGDVLYFVLWVAQLGASASLGTHVAGLPPSALLFDFSSMGVAIFRLEALLHSSGLSVGAAEFSAALAPVTLPGGFWTMPMVLGRLSCALFALLPLIPAVLLFHRFSPDLLRGAGARKRWSPPALANRLLRPLSGAARPLFALAARSPGLAGQVLADTALALAASPWALAAMALLLPLGALLPQAALAGLLTVAVALWGVLISDVSVRDVQAGVDGMSAAAGGAARRYLRQFLATCVLAVLFMGPVGLRWIGVAPLRAAALASGVFALTAAAGLLGRCTGGARAFLALFLFGLYVATQAVGVPALDVVGFNGVATGASIMLQSALGAVLCALGFAHHRWRE